MKESGTPGDHRWTQALESGETIALRPIETDDADGLVDLYSRLSDASIYARFLSYPKPTPDILYYLTHVDGRNHVALVAEVDGRIVAVGRFIRIEERPSHADAAITVADAWQGRGIGRLVLSRLGTIAREFDVTVFEFDVLAENTRLARLLERLDRPMRSHVVDGVVHYELELTDS